MRRLERTPDRQLAVHLVHRRDAAAGFERARVNALVDDPLARDDRSRRDCPRRPLGIADFPGEDVIVMLARTVRAARLVLQVLAQHRRVGGERLVRIDERRQGLVFDLDEIDGIGRDIAVLGDDESDLLALEQHLFVG
jgi:hypothetical protein